MVPIAPEENPKYWISSENCEVPLWKVTRMRKCILKTPSHLYTTGVASTYLCQHDWHSVEPNSNRLQERASGMTEIEWDQEGSQVRKHGKFWRFWIVYLGYEQGRACLPWCLPTLLAYSWRISPEVSTHSCPPPSRISEHQGFPWPSRSHPQWTKISGGIEHPAWQRERLSCRAIVASKQSRVSSHVHGDPMRCNEWPSRHIWTGQMISQREFRYRLLLARTKEGIYVCFGSLQSLMQGNDECLQWIGSRVQVEGCGWWSEMHWNWRHIECWYGDDWLWESRAGFSSAGEMSRGCSGYHFVIRVGSTHQVRQ